MKHVLLIQEISELFNSHIKTWEKSAKSVKETYLAFDV